MLPLYVLLTKKNPTNVSFLASVSLKYGKADVANLTDKPQPTLAFLGVEMSAHVTPCDDRKLYARRDTFLDL